MNYVQPSYAENVCDSTREEEIVVICGTAISAIFIKKVTRLMGTEFTFKRFFACVSQNVLFHIGFDIRFYRSKIFLHANWTLKLIFAIYRRMDFN